MVNQRYRGMGTALVTPFTSGGAVDEPALIRLVDLQLDNGVDMLLPCGTTGESPSLEADEWERIVSLILERVDGRVPVIVGAGSNSTAHAVAMTRRTRQLSADAVLSVGPYYNRPQQEGYFQHFKAIAESDGIPVVVYNVPPRTSGNILAETTLRLAEVPGIVAVKEASGDMAQVGEILRHRPEGFSVLCGDDPLTVAEIAMGADGVVSVTSNVAPALFGGMVRSAMAGDIDQARRVHYRLLPLIRATFLETSPAPVKALLSIMGLMEDTCRLPLVSVGESTRVQLREAAGELGLL